MDRRKFLRMMSLFGFGALTYAVYKNLSFYSKPPGKRIILTKEELAKSLVFKDEVIVVRKGDRIKVFSRRCPHLGCFLSYDSYTEEIVCPCHKSKFTLEGKYITGPAKKDLIEFSFNEKKEGLEVEVF